MLSTILSLYHEQELSLVYRNDLLRVPLHPGSGLMCTKHYGCDTSYTLTNRSILSNSDVVHIAYKVRIVVILIQHLYKDICQTGAWWHPWVGCPHSKVDKGKLFMVYLVGHDYLTCLRIQMDQACGSSWTCNQLSVLMFPLCRCHLVTGCEGTRNWYTSLMGMCLSKLLLVKPVT